MPVAAGNTAGRSGGGGANVTAVSWLRGPAGRLVRVVDAEGPGPDRTGQVPPKLRVHVADPADRVLDPGSHRGAGPLGGRARAADAAAQAVGLGQRLDQGVPL